MRLLACDFDGTIFRKHTISAEDLEAVRAWRAAGNLFAIVTGRGALTLMHELPRFPLEWDFLLCNNGAILMDEQARVTGARLLGPELSRYLLNHEVARHCDSTAVFDGDAMFVLEGSGPWINEVYDPPFMPRGRALERNFSQVSFGFRDRDLAFEWGDRLTRELEGRARVQCSLSVADVISLESGKDTGIAWACEMRGWQPEEILTVGDDGNDIEMLARYSGWAIEGSDEAVTAAARGTVASIADLISTRYC